MKWSTLAEKVHQSLTKNALLNKKDKILIALSGGMDSVVLLNVFLELRSYWQWELIAGHINHGLRPGEDEKESELCKNISEKAGLRYLETKLELKNKKHYNNDYKGNQKASLESLARHERYNTFEFWANEYDCNAVCTGHHQGDQAETIIYRMLTGSGIKGMKGIPESRGIYKRPLLEISKKHIQTYAADNKLDYLNDSSNQDVKFIRNRIRHIILPFIKENGFSNAEDMLSSSATALEQASLALEYYGERALKDVLIDMGTRIEVNRQLFIVLPEYIKKYVLKAAYRDYLNVTDHLSEEQLNSMIRFIISAVTGSSMIFMDKKILMDRNKIILLSEKQKGFSNTLICDPIQKNINGLPFKIDYKFKQSNNELAINDQCVANFSQRLLNKELRIRNWEPGDSMKLFGSGNTKKISDILKDEKVSALTKTDHPVLLYEDEVIWIPGVKRSDLFKVNLKDDKYIQITYLKWSEK